jgi:Staphylococcal nuclease homologue
VLIAPALAEDLIGQASVIDGDTLEIHGTRIRVFGIDAPESDQLCRNEKSDVYRCGQKTSNALFDFIARRPVECVEVDRDRYKRAVSVCTVGGTDIADWLVRNGLALDWPQYSQSYSVKRNLTTAETVWGLQTFMRFSWNSSSVAGWQKKSFRRLRLSNLSTKRVANVRKHRHIRADDLRRQGHRARQDERERAGAPSTTLLKHRVFRRRRVSSLRSIPEPGR